MSSAQFDAAAAWLSTSPAGKTFSNDKKLELYGLFKFANADSGPQGPRPGIFSFEGRAKYDSWARIATEYAGRTEDARKRYVDIAREAGWTEAAVAVPVAKQEEEDVDLENLSDSDDDEAAVGGGAAGFGPSVSVLSQEEGADGSPIQAAAASNNASAVEALLAADAALLNAKDEFGYTPLHTAADRGSADVVRVLVARGADLSIVDPDGQTALDLARISDRDDIVALLQ